MLRVSRRFRQRIRRRSVDDDRGTMAVELVILLPLALMFVLLLVMFGRVAEAHSAAEAAARDGARAGSIARQQDARSAAEAAVTGDLAGEKELDCGAPAISTINGGTAMQVRLTCTVDITGLSLIPGIKQPSVSGTSVSPIDTYRGTN